MPALTRRAKSNRRKMKSIPQPLSAERRRAAADRRTARSNHRVPLALPVRICTMGEDRLDEITVTHDVSGKGLYFFSSKPFQAGQPVSVALNYQPDIPDALALPAEIVRIDTSPGAGGHGSAVRGIAVKYV